MSIVFNSIPEVHRWLVDQGYDITDRSVRTHIKRGLLPAGRSRNGKVKTINQSDLERYAKTHLQRRREVDPSDNRARLLKEQADKLELENNIKRGKYLDREEEEKRDAAILAGFRRHIESFAADRLQEILASISKLVNEDTRSKLIAMQPVLLQQDLDFLDGMFDRFKGV